MSGSATPPARRKRLMLGGALLLTCVAALWPVDEEPQTAARSAKALPLARSTAVAMAQTPAARRASPLPSAAAPTALPDRSAWASAAVHSDPFKGLAGEPSAAAPVPKPASAPASALPHPPPPAPTVPWPFAGRLIVPGQPNAVLLHDGNRTLTLPLGDTLGDWRFDADRGQQLDFTHLPTGATVVLPVSP